MTRACRKSGCLRVIWEQDEYLPLETVGRPLAGAQSISRSCQRPFSPLEQPEGVAVLITRALGAPADHRPGLSCPLPGPPAPGRALGDVARSSPAARGEILPGKSAAIGQVLWLLVRRRKLEQASPGKVALRAQRLRETPGGAPERIGCQQDHPARRDPARQPGVRHLGRTTPDGRRPAQVHACSRVPANAIAQASSGFRRFPQRPSAAACAGSRLPGLCRPSNRSAHARARRRPLSAGRWRSAPRASEGHGCRLPGTGRGGSQQSVRGSRDAHVRRRRERPQVTLCFLRSLLRVAATEGAGSEAPPREQSKEPGSPSGSLQDLLDTRGARTREFVHVRLHGGSRVRLESRRTWRRSGWRAGCARVLGMRRRVADGAQRGRARNPFPPVVDHPLRRRRRRAVDVKSAPPPPPPPNTYHGGSGVRKILQLVQGLAEGGDLDDLAAGRRRARAEAAATGASAEVSLTCWVSLVRREVLGMRAADRDDNLPRDSLVSGAP